MSLLTQTTTTENMTMNENELRAAFWATHVHQEIPGQEQNKYHADIRAAWCEFIDWSEREGVISMAMAAEVTL